MLKRVFALLLCLALVASAGCAYRRSEPHRKETLPDLPGKTQPPENVERPLPRAEDNLAKSDEEAVEENINGVDLEDDFEITERAESESTTQSKVGLTQNEMLRIGQQMSTAANVNILQNYYTIVPTEITLNLKYNQYATTYDYFLITAENQVDILESPQTGSAVICHGTNSEKLALHQKVAGEAIGDSNIWYMVSCKDDGSIKTGYIHSANGVPRTFQFDKMLQSVRELERQVKEGKLNFISNYKNANGAPPKKGDSATDEYGTRIYQSAPGYTSPDTNSDFRYIPDGILLRILGETGDFYKVKVLTYDGEYFVPKKYIEADNALTQLSQAIVVDRNQQNQATFEIGSDGSISMVSYTYATTGLQGASSFATPLGFYKSIEKKDKFHYLKDGSSEIAGYAPFAIRFCGGAYVHGVPVAYKEENGEKVDPGHIEYLQTIGTFPRSHMCVRNYTSHAKFLYDLVDPAVSAIIVIE
jgi:hypothetical protein